MKIQRILFLCIAFLCNFRQASGESIVSVVSTNTPIGQYSLVNFDDGLTASIVAASVTTLTFRVEWQPDLQISCSWLELLVTQNLADENWVLFSAVPIKHPKQGYKEYFFFIDESSALWYDKEGFRIPQIFFRFKEHELQDASAYVDSEVTLEELRRRAKEDALETRLRYESSQERFAERARLDALGATEEEQKAAEARLIAKFKQRLSDALARLAAEEAAGEATASPPNRLWLYVGILFALSAIFYFVRRKLKTGN